MYRTVVTICTTSLTFHNSTFCPHSVFMCFVWISEQTAIISLYNINWSVRGYRRILLIDTKSDDRIQLAIFTLKCASQNYSKPPSPPSWCSPQCFGPLTCPLPLTADSLFEGRPCLRSPHSWCFIIKCAIVSVCLSLSIAEQFQQFWIVFSTGLILSFVKISLLNLQCCQVYLAFLLINCISVDVILHLSCCLIAQVPHPYNKKINAKTLNIFSLVCLWTVNNSSYLDKC